MCYRSQRPKRTKRDQGRKFMRIILDVENSNEGRALMVFLKQLSFVKIEEIQKKRRKKLEIEGIFGLWSDRDITKKQLREKAWRM